VEQKTDDDKAAKDKSETDAKKEDTQTDPEKPAPTGNKVKISTPYGDMIAILYDECPEHKANFLKLADEGFYDDLLFHRVIQGFMIQGGDPNSRGADPAARLGSGGPGYTVPAEFNPNFVHKKGALSAARQGDQVNPEKRSSGSQFYVVQGKKQSAEALVGMEKQVAASSRTEFKYTDDQINAYVEEGGTPFLDMNYTVFGEVISGLEVIDKIAAVQTRPGDRPVEDVTMRITIIE
jgi:cyclophilin family peptidyl-prolyl cis-trans isomerase